jgi:hypothetical protein
MKTITGYTIIRPLGAGGMARVFEALRLQDGQRVALKVLADHATDPDDLRRFLREGEVIRRLTHPSIITIYEAGEENGRPFLAMELLEGGSLEALLQRQGRLAPDHAIGMILPVLDALGHAHAHGLIHRDIKPANVLLRADSTPVLADFDLARQQRPDSRSRITMDGELLGTPAYMAPEQLRGGELDARTDLYACGAMLFELLTGRPPFDGDMHQVIVGHLQDQPPSIQSLASIDRPELDWILGRMLAKNPADRPPTADSVIRDLTEIRDRRAGATGPTITLQQPAAARPVAQQPAAARPVAPPLQPIQVRPGVAGTAIGVAFIGVLALLAVFLLVVIQRGRSFEADSQPESILLPIATALAAPTATPIAVVEITTVVDINTEVLITPVGTPIQGAPSSLRLLSESPLVDPQVLETSGGQVTIGSAQAVPVIDSGVLLVFADVRNDGEATLLIGGINLRLVDSKGQTLASTSGLLMHPFLGAGKTVPFIAAISPEEPIAPEVLEQSRVVIDEVQTIDGAANEQFPLPIESLQVTDPSVGVPGMVIYQISGEVRNPHEHPLGNLRATLVLYDSNGRIVLVQDNNVTEDGGVIAPGESATLSISGFSFKEGAVSYRIYAVGEAPE